MRGMRLHLSVSSLVFQTDARSFPLNAVVIPFATAPIEHENDCRRDADTNNNIFRVLVHGFLRLKGVFHTLRPTPGAGKPGVERTRAVPALGVASTQEAGGC